MADLAPTVVKHPILKSVARSVTGKGLARREKRVTHRVRNVVIGAAVLIAGVIGLFLPVSVFDGGHSTIACGNAVMADESTWTAANATSGDVAFRGERIPHPDYVAACQDAISGRRHWAIPLTIVGAAGILVGLFFRGGRGAVPK